MAVSARVERDDLCRVGQARQLELRRKVGLVLSAYSAAGMPPTPPGATSSQLGSSPPSMKGVAGEAVGKRAGRSQPAHSNSGSNTAIVRVIRGKIVTGVVFAPMPQQRVEGVGARAGQRAGKSREELCHGIHALHGGGGQSVESTSLHGLPSQSVESTSLHGLPSQGIRVASEHVTTTALTAISHAKAAAEAGAADPTIMVHSCSHPVSHVLSTSSTACAIASAPRSLVCTPSLP